MDAPGPARLYATLGGALLVAVGIAGFFYSASFGSPGDVGQMLGAFAVNGWENTFHALTGAAGLIAADYHSRRYALCNGALYFALGFWGFVIGSGDAVLGLLPVSTGDNLLHLAIGALGLLAWRAGAAPAKRAPATA
jgi:hypothetical protein